MSDYEFDAGPIVTLVNRTSKSLEMRFHGRTHVFKPGKNLTNAVYAARAKRTFPRRGTEDPRHPGMFVCLVGVEEWGDDVSPIEQSNAPELLDRSKLDPDRQDAVLVTSRDIIPLDERGARAPLPVDGAFGIQPKA